MARGVTRFMEEDHAQLGRLLGRCLGPADRVDLEAFDAFRHHLLRHICIEEKVLMPRLVRAMGRAPLFQNGLRKDHAGIAALCVPVPCREWVEDLAELLSHHQQLEENAGGFYDLIDLHLSDEAELRRAIADLPPLWLPPFDSGPRVRELLARVLFETGVATGAFPLSVL